MSQLKEMLRDTAKLVTIPSVSGEEHAAARYVYSQLKDFGHHPEMTDTGDGVYALVRGKTSEGIVVVNGHLDTTPYRFRADLRLRKGSNRGWYRGHGSGDMKAGVAIQLDIARELARKKSRYDVLFSFVPREELDGTGTDEQASIFKEQYLPEYPPEAVGGVILEPTHVGENDFYVGFGNRGRANLLVKAKGVTGHSGLDFRTQTTAIGRIGRLADSLPQIQDDLALKYADRFGIPTINATSVQAGIADNVVPDEAEMGLDIRSTEALASDWNAFVKKLEMGFGVSIRYADHSRVTVEACDPRSRIYQVAERDVTPELMQPFRLGASDMPGFKRVGIETVLYGPGDITYAHTGNDRVHPNALMNARQRVGRMIESFAVFDANEARR